MQKYEVAAHTLELDGLAGDFDVIIKTDISLAEAQQLTIANIGKYAGDVWPQYSGTKRPSAEDVALRKAEILAKQEPQD